MTPRRSDRTDRNPHIGVGRLPNKNQRGIILFFTLIAIVLVLVASVALVRSFDTTLGIAGNIAFKRDLINQSERGVAAAVSLFSGAGALSAPASREANQLANNYSATMLAADRYGVPNILLNDTAWIAGGLGSTNDIADGASHVTVRYVIDRLCRALTAGELAAPAGSVKTSAYCMAAGEGDVKGGTIHLQRPGGTTPIVYRISIRVTGPRNTQTFVQQNISL